MNLTVALVDDHPVFREGLKTLLSAQSDIEVVGDAANAKAALEMASATKPGVLIIDITLPDGDGIATTHEILRQSPRTRVLMLTMHTSEFFVSRAFSAGVTGYALKSQPADEILEGVRTVGRGDTYVAPCFSNLFARQRDTRRPPGGNGAGGPLDELSKREREIFDLILRGFTNENMAGTLKISVKTIETHRSHINRKLRVHSTGELIRLAALHGLIAQ